MFDPDEMENPVPPTGSVARAILDEGVFALELGALRKHAQLCEQAGWTPADVQLVAECARENGKRRLETVFATMLRERSWAFVLENARKWREDRKRPAPGQAERQQETPLRNRNRRTMTWDEKVALTREVADEFGPDDLPNFARYMGESIDGARALLAEAERDLTWAGSIPARSW